MVTTENGKTRKYPDPSRASSYDVPTLGSGASRAFSRNVPTHEPESIKAGVLGLRPSTALGRANGSQFDDKKNSIYEKLKELDCAVSRFETSFMPAIYPAPVAESDRPEVPSSCCEVDAFIEILRDHLTKSIANIHNICDRSAL